MTELIEDPDHREVWFIFSPRPEPWANLRIATFTKASNAPNLDLVAIHNESRWREGLRVWDDIAISEGWIKVRRIELPTAAEVREAIAAAGSKT